MKLKIENLTCVYRQEPVFENLNMEAAEGEFVSILGPSGCGKSTLLNIVSGTLKPDTGRILVDGEPVSGIGRHFAYMPQADLLLPWKTIMDNVCLSGRIQGSMKEARRLAAQRFADFGLGGYEDKYPHQLSGGMRQRAAFLRTALCPADILLLDEPFGALDVITRGDMQDWLADIRVKMNKTIVLVTHDIDEAIYLSDRILVMTGKPAKFTESIGIEEAHRNRNWLFDQHMLKSRIYDLLRG